MNFQERLRLTVDSNLVSRWTELTTAQQDVVFSQLSDSSPKPHPLDHSPMPMVQTLKQHLTDILLASETSQAALKQMSQVMATAFQADDCIFLQRTLSPERFQVLASTAPSLNASLQEKHPLLSLFRHPKFHDWIIDGKPLVLPDRSTARSFLADTPQAEESIQKSSLSLKSPVPFGAVLAIRTLFQGQINGAIILLRSQPYQWTELDVQLLETLADPAAIAISQAQLEQHVQKQIQYQTLIDQLTRAIRSTWSVEQIFRLAVEGAVSALQASRGMILLLKYSNPLYTKSRNGDRAPQAKATVTCEFPAACEWPGQPEWTTFGATEAPADTANCLYRPFWVSDCSLCQHMFDNGASPIAISTFNKTSNSDAVCELVNFELDEVAAVFNPEEMPALLLVPLENQGKILGCLVIQQTSQRFWHFEEVSFLKLVAAQLSTAIIQTQTLRQVQALVDERTAQLQRSLDVQAKLYEKTRQQVDQLRRLNEIREEFLSTLSHELLTPLTSMALAIRMLRQSDLSPDRRMRYLDILEQQCTQETNLINDLLALQKLETNAASTHLQKIDIKYLVRDLVQSFEETFAERGLRLAIDLPARPLTLHTDLDSLNRILVELFTNAKKYADPDTTVHLRVIHELNQSAGQIMLMISNEGSGISAEELPYIFDKFRRGAGVTQRAIQGTGLGLALVKGLAEHLNGAIAATSEPIDQGEVWKTCFTLTLPQFPDGFVYVNS